MSDNNQDKNDNPKEPVLSFGDQALPPLDVHNGDPEAFARAEALSRVLGDNEEAMARVDLGETAARDVVELKEEADATVTDGELTVQHVPTITESPATTIPETTSTTTPMTITSPMGGEPQDESGGATPPSKTAKRPYIGTHEVTEPTRSDYDQPLAFGEGE